MWKSKFNLLLVCTLSLASLASHAGGGPATGGASEWTQLMNNAELAKSAMDNAITSKATVDQYIMQVKQYETQVANLARLPKIPSSMGQVIGSYRSLQAYSSSIGRLYGSLSRQSDVMNKRFSEARLSGMSWDQYVQQQKDLANNNNQRAIARLNYEKETLDQVNQDYEFARSIQDQIPETVGQQANLQLLNSQMNRLVSQNAKMIEVVSQSNQADKDSQEAAAAHRATQMQDYNNKYQQQMRQRQRDFFGQ